MVTVVDKALRLVCVAMVLACVATAQAQGVRETLLEETQASLAAARAADVALLSPANFSEAEKYFQRAEDRVARGRKLEDIRSDLADANRALEAAKESARLARLTFEDAIESRSDAKRASADTLAPETWDDAEEEFERAALRLEDGDINRAKGYADDAEAVYREAELIAIQGAILNEARKLLAAADDARADRYAPKTFAKAQRLVAQAEADLGRDRYATEAPLAMAREAEYEARHALYITGRAEAVDDDDITTEDIILEWEGPLARIAETLDSSRDLSEGYAVSRDASLARIDDLQSKAAQLEPALTRVAELEEQLGISTDRVQESERRRRQVQDLEALFDPQEARILREGGTLIIRLIGLQFDSGESVIESRYFRLLRKIADVPTIYPGARLTVEGHTDSVGNDTMNLALSERRANSVRDYLLASTILPASQIEAVGYGETRPIANNETASGRAMNRRTDVVVIPGDR